MSAESGTMPKGWGNAPLPAICDIVMGQSPPSSTYRESSEGLPFFQGKAEFGELFPTARKWCVSPNKIANVDDVLLSIRAPVGPTNIASERCCIGRGLAALRPASEIEGRYIFHALRHFEEKLASVATGTTFKAVSGRIISTFEIPVAPSLEQRRIVAKIEALQARTRQAREALAEVGPLLEQFRQSLLAAAFRGDLTADWRAANLDVEPATELLQRIRKERRQKWEQAELAKYEAKGKQPPDNWQNKCREPEPVDDSELSELPHGWSWATLDELATSMRSGNSATSIKTKTDWPILRSSAIRAGAMDYSDVNFMPADEPPDSPNILAEGDLMVTRLSGSLEYVGMCAIVGGLNGRRIQYPDRLFRLRLVPDICARFVMFAFQCHSLRTGLESSAKSSAGHQRISLSDLRSFLIPVPPLNEQVEIVDRVSSCLVTADSMRDVSEFTASDLTQLDQSILAKAFRGELVPQDASDEPASVLLERIRQQREGLSAGEKNGKKTTRRRGKKKAKA